MREAVFFQKIELELAQLFPQNTRINAGHSYEAVKWDMARYACLLQKNGILRCDDFFLNRWPEVTMAIFDTYQEAGLVPIALVNRKAYFTRVEDAEVLQKKIHSVHEAIGVFGEVKHWDVTLRGAPVNFYQMQVRGGVSNTPL